MTVRLIKRNSSAYSYPLLIKNLLSAPLNHSPDQEIIYSDISRYTYKELFQRVSSLANLLCKIGVKKGSTVGVMDWDSHRYLESYFAVPMIGAVLHTINIRLSTDQLIYTLNHAEDDVLFVNKDFLPMLEPIMDKIKSVKAIVLLSDGGEKTDTKLDIFGEYEALMATSFHEYLFEDFNENAIATLFYTTGTTGLPKGVYFSHRQIVLHTYGFMSGLCAYDGQLKINSGDVYMPLTPMFHVHAWGMPYLFTMLGNKQVYPGRFKPDKVLQLVNEHKVSFSHCVPTIVHMLLDDPLMDTIDISGWKLIIGGSALTKNLCTRAQKKGIFLFTAYGMSETCPLLTISDLKSHMKGFTEEDQVNVRCLTGLPVPNVQIEIIGTDGTPLPHDGKAAGEIVARSPWLTQGYYKDEEKSKTLWADGWLHTGDIGTINPDGYLKIIDRIKDVIKTGGEWISSLELEDIVTRHESVNEAAVIGISDSKWGERPLVLVVLNEAYKDKISEADLKNYYLTQAQKGEIPKYGVPDRIEFVENIAKTSVGKINKKELRKQYT
jgi:fatty-acyl-CoA synthase